ncbi:MAG: hypothetical protein IJZ57_00860 [Clostridia bacterium]|nr:hypothetical protein [Clostridia bacterium]
MKKLFYSIVTCAVILSLTACSSMSVSTKMYNEIYDHVTQNIDTLSPTKETEFYDYEATGISVGGVYYGYYYSENNEFIIPDFYKGNDFDTIKNDTHEAEDGIYFGKPNNGTDWCYIKKITNHWYYYELHWA